MTRFEKSWSIYTGKGLARAYLPMKMEETECSETSAYKTQTPWNYPEEIIRHSEHGEKFEIKNRFSFIAAPKAVGLSRREPASAGTSRGTSVIMTLTHETRCVTATILCKRPIFSLSLGIVRKRY